MKTGHRKFKALALVNPAVKAIHQQALDRLKQPECVFKANALHIRTGARTRDRLVQSKT